MCQKLPSLRQLLAVANMTQSEWHHAYSQGSAGPPHGDHYVLSSLQCSSLSSRHVQFQFTQSMFHTGQKHPPQFIVHFQNRLLTVFSATQVASVHKHTIPLSPTSFRAALLRSQHHPELLVWTWRGQVKQKYSFSEILKKKNRLSRLPWYKVSHAGFCPARAAFPRSHYQYSQLQQADAYAGCFCCIKSLSAGRGINYKQARRNFCSIDGCSAGCFSLY